MVAKTEVGTYPVHWTLMLTIKIREVTLMQYNMIKKKHYYGEHYGSVRTGFIIGLDKSQETVNQIVPYSFAVEPPPPLPPSVYWGVMPPRKV